MNAVAEVHSIAIEPVTPTKYLKTQLRAPVAHGHWTATAGSSDGHYMDTTGNSVVPYNPSKSLKIQLCAPVAQVDRATVS
jgi:hypothetical protein